MALKLLLVVFTTNRDIDGQSKRVRFAPGKVVDLFDDEIELLENLTKATGKLHFRDPISEGGPVVASEPEIVTVPDFEGQTVPMGEKTVEQLKAYLTFHSVEFPASANKAALLDLATKHEAGDGDSGDDDSGDPDSGL